MSPLAHCVLSFALDDKDAAVLYFNDRVVSAGDLAERTVDFADYLSGREYPTKTLALCENNSVDFIAVFLAANLLGLNVQVYSPDWPESLIDATRYFLKPDRLIGSKLKCQTTGDDSTRRVLREAKKKHDITKWIRLGKGHANSHHAFYTGFTSGSTGLPKGFMRTEKSWLDSFKMDENAYGLNRQDTIVCLGNFAHSLFFYALLRGLYGRIPVVAASQFRPTHFLKMLRQKSSSVIFAVPTQLQTLVEHCRHKKLSLPDVRLVLSAGAKLPVDLQSALKTIFPAAGITEFYGSSELGYISMASDQLSTPLQSVGRAVAGVDIRILDANLKSVPANVTGQIFVKSPFKFMGYAGPNGKIEYPIHSDCEGYLACGDTGYLDESGYLYISGRSDRMMLIAGRNCFPENIEAVLSQFAGVSKVAVFSEPDSLRGERPVAIIEPDPNAKFSRHSLIVFARSYLPDYEVPRKYYVQKQWPLTVSHKTDLQKLYKQMNSQKLEILD